MSMVITLWMPLITCQTITYIMNSSNKLPGHPRASNSHCRKEFKKPNTILGKPLHKHLGPEFCHISGSNRKTQSWCWVVLKRHCYSMKVPVINVGIILLN
jgi:hypothetical protein